ncbi:MAG: 5-(carboxyamino)imidazole ribonucleotide synthase [Deltaproteobacteria bacterium]|nr:5-(carboxyamino)imidazole ribonucleotide synthase [Deltaproteobacteria bacterium]
MAWKSKHSAPPGSRSATHLRPGATIGILGGGPLGRMLAMEGARMGFRSVVLDDDPAAPAVAVSDGWIRGSLLDLDAARELGRRVDVVTVDTDQVPAAVLAELDRLVPVRPGAFLVETLQDRVRQRAFLARAGLPAPRTRPVATLDELTAAARELGGRTVLKTRRAGNDGRGQARLTEPGDAARAFAEIGGARAILEEHVAFERELSVVVARSESGADAVYPVAENRHVQHVLHEAIVPAEISPRVAARAGEIAREAAAALHAVGVITVELFLRDDGELLVNEIAPRVHNSGHFSLGATATSQFEQHLRAITGLPLGDASQLCPAVMVNLLGDLWATGEPPWDRVLSLPGIRLHLYGRSEPRPGLEMGHLLATARDPAQALATAREAYGLLAAGTESRPSLVPRSAPRHSSTLLPAAARAAV